MRLHASLDSMCDGRMHSETIWEKFNFQLADGHKNPDFSAADRARKHFKLKSGLSRTAVRVAREERECNSQSSRAGLM